MNKHPPRCYYQYFKCEMKTILVELNKESNSFLFRNEYNIKSDVTRRALIFIVLKVVNYDRKNMVPCCQKNKTIMGLKPIKTNQTNSQPSLSQQYIG